jgi:filamentous hemagglutinin family protein
MHHRYTRWLLTSTTILGLAIPGVAAALPSGGQVVAGQASIASPNSNQVTITQSSSRAVINWGSFNVSAGQKVQFKQPNASSITLNRITDGGTSQIDGQLTANGRVWLINPGGIVFAHNAQVNVGGLLATTANIDDSDFIAGNYQFKTPGNPTASIVNQGSITVKQAGLATLVAPNVINQGTITATLGKVQLASGDTFALDTYGDGLINLAVSPKVAQQLVQNSGKISANGGQVQLTAAAGEEVLGSLINNTGLIEAESVDGKTGQITMYAEGSNAVAGNVGANKGKIEGTSEVLNSGTLDASGYGKGQTGGTIQVLGDNVGILTGSKIDASGDAGGGTIRIGGDFHGAGTTPTALHTIVESGTTTLANAVTNGTGGKVTVWADDWTNFAGDIEAKGGARSGNGGYVETSGHITLNAVGNVDASAPHGNGGTWLLDPTAITISTGTQNGITGDPNFTNTLTGAVLKTSSVTNDLNLGTNVTVTTSASFPGDIVVANAISESYSGTVSLTLSASGNIIINSGANIGTTGGPLNIVLDSYNAGTGSGYISVGANLTSNGGNITLGGGALSGGLPSGAAVGGSTSGFQYGIKLSSSTLNAGTPGACPTGGCNITLNGTGGTYASGQNHGIYMASSAIETSGTGTINLTGTGGGTSNQDWGVYITTGGLITTSGTGAISLTGVGGGASSTNNYGIVMDGGSIAPTGAAPINLTGTAGYGSTVGLDLGPPSFANVITSGGGTVTLASPTSIYLSNAGITYASGDSFNAVLDADTGGVAGGINLGISNISTNGGNITLGGGALVGGLPSGAAVGTQDGIYFGSGTLNAGTTGTCPTGGCNITLNGQGGTVSGGQNYGIVLYNGTNIIETSGTGTITHTGTGGSPSNTDYGIWLDSGSITSGTGAISLTGIGGGTSGASNNYGIYISNSSIAATGNAPINLTGTAGNSTSYGIFSNLASFANVITSGGGAVTLASPNSIYLNDTGITYAAGDSFNAVFDANTSNTSGFIQLGSSTISTNGGTIALGGGALSGGLPTGAAVGGSTANTAYGIYLSSSTLNAGTTGTCPTGGCNITLDGQGGTYTSLNDGLYILGGTSNIETTGAGTINLTGTGGTYSATTNYGIYMTGGSISSTGTGAINLTGAAGTGTLDGIDLNPASFANVITSGGGTVTLASPTSIGLTNAGITHASGDYFNTVLDSDTGGTVGEILLSGSTVSTNGGNITLGGGALSGGLPSGAAVGTSGGGNQSGIELTSSTLNAGTSGACPTGGCNITLDGQGGTYASGSNIGVYVLGGTSAIETTGAGTINLTGTGGVGSTVNYGIYQTGGTISAGSGAINLTGTGGSASSAENGIDIIGGSITSTTGTISLTGTGGGTSGSNIGIFMSGGSIAPTGNAPINLTGTAGFGTVYGIDLNPGSFTNVITSGGGTVTLASPTSMYLYDAGITYASGDSFNTVIDADTSGTSGMIFMAGGASISTNGGNITLGGGALSGGLPSGAAVGTSGSTLQYGIELSSSTLNAGASGACPSGGCNITLNGQGGTYASGGNHGIYIGTSSISTTGAGTINLTGTGGGPSSNDNGIYFLGGSITTTGTGAISLTGTGGGASSTNNYGIYMTGGSIAPTGAAAINLTGTAGYGTTAGIDLNSASATTLITSGGGTVTLASPTEIYLNNAGITYASGDYFNMVIDADTSGALGGIEVTGSSTISTNGGNINLGGGALSGGLPSGPAIGPQGGIYFPSGTLNAGTTGTCPTGGCNITLDGTGGNNAGGSNIGILMQGGTIETSGAGTINFTGTGGSVGSAEFGIDMNGGTIASGSGAINLTGNGGVVSGSSNYGINISGGSIASTTGTIDIVGTGGGTSGSSNVGIFMGGGSIAPTGTAAINLTGTAGFGTLFGIDLAPVSTTTLITSAGGAVTLASPTSINLSKTTITYASGDNFNVVLDSDTGGTSGAIILGSSTISTNGGNINFGGGSLSGGLPSGAAVGTSTIAYGVEISSSTLNAGTSGACPTGGCNITLNGQGGTYSSGTNYGVYLTGGTVETTGAGAISLTGIGGGSGASGSNIGIDVASGSTVETSGTGAISLTGIGGGSGASGGNTGASIGGTVQSTGAGGGGITIIGYSGDNGGTGGNNFGTSISGTVSSVDGNILIDGNTGISGQAVTTSTGSYNYGLNLGGSITSTGHATITLNGIGGGSGASAEDFGIDSYSQITSASGNISLTGTAATAPTGLYQWGIYMTGGSVQSTGTATVSITGIGGGSGASGGNTGISMVGGTVNSTSTGGGGITLIGYGGDNGGTGAGSNGLSVGGTVSSVDGNILIDGNTGISGQAVTTTTGNQNYGISTSGSISSTGHATITMNGIGGGSGASGYDHGIYMAGGTVNSTATGGGGITLIGYGGDNGGTGAGSYGLYLGGGTVSSVDGNIVFDGNTGISGQTITTTTGNQIYGLQLAGGSISSTGHATITLNGIGGPSGSSDLGIYLSGGSITTSGTGTINLTGTAGSPSNSDYGIQMSGGTIASSTGAINITGTGGGASSTNNYGIYMTGGSIAPTGNAPINLTGTAGFGTTWGIELIPASAATLITSGGGTVTLASSAGINLYNTGITYASGDTFNAVLDADTSNTTGNIYLTNSTISTNGGNINLGGDALDINGLPTGAAVGTSGSTFQYGIEVSSSTLNAGTTGTCPTGGCNITLNGQGGTYSSGSNYGIYLNGSNLVETTGTGAISLTGVAGTTGTGNYGIDTASTGNAIGGASDNGNITFTADTLSMSGFSAQTTGTVTFEPYTANTSVGVDGATGTLQVTGAILGDVTASDITVGATGDTNTLTMPTYSWGTAATLITGSGLLSITGTQTMGSHNLTLQSDNLSIGGNLSGTGTLTILPSNVSDTIGLAGGSGTLSISAAQLNYIQSGWAGITIGNTSDTNLMSLNSYGWNAPLTLLSGSGSIAINGAQTMGGNTFLADTLSGNIALGSSGSISSSASGNAITLAASDGNFTNGNSSSSALSATGGRWLVYSTNPASDNDGALSNSFRRFSCTYGGSCPSIPASGNGLLYSYTPYLTATPNSFAITYGTSANLTGYAYSLSGYLGSDGSHDGVTGSLNGATNYTLGSPVGNYNIDYSAGSLASSMGYGFTYANNTGGLTVNPATLTVGGSFTAKGKTYDRTTTATIATNSLTLSGLYSGDTGDVSLNSVAAFLDYNAGVGKTVDLTSGSTLTGSAAGNYILSLVGAPTTTATISAKTLYASLTGLVDKTYDRTTTATLASGNYNLSGVIGGDSVSLNDPTGGSYDTRNVGTGKTVSVSGLSISGGDAGNYILSSNAINGAVGEIDAKTLYASLTGLVDKTYDRTTTATLASGNYNLSGVIGGDSVSLNDPTGGSYDTRNVGTGKTVSVTGLSISGGDAGNYILASNAINGSVGEIDAKTLFASLTGTVDKTYDRTTAATLASGNYSLSGVIGGDTVSLNNPTGGSYDTRNVGTGKTVSVSGLSISGGDAGNYILASNAINGSVGEIDAKTLFASLTGTVDKTYDRTTDATLGSGNYSLSGVIGGDTVSLNDPTGGSYDTRNVGTGKTVSVTGLSISGGDAGNYILASNAINGSVGEIDAKTLTASLTGTVDKTYDRTTTATLASGNYSLSGVISGDTVSLNNPVNGTYDNPNVGVSKLVYVSGVAIYGSGAGNYRLASSNISGAVGQIDGKAVTVTADNEAKYFGALVLPLTYTYSGTSNGSIFSGTLSTSATQLSNAGTYAIDQGTLTAGGNYSLTFVPGTLTIVPIPNTVIQAPFYTSQRPLNSASYESSVGSPFSGQARQSNSNVSDQQLTTFAPLAGDTSPSGLIYVDASLLSAFRLDRADLTWANGIVSEAAK